MRYNRVVRFQTVQGSHSLSLSAPAQQPVAHSVSSSSQRSPLRCLLSSLRSESSPTNAPHFGVYKPCGLPYTGSEAAAEDSLVSRVAAVAPAARFSRVALPMPSRLRQHPSSGDPGCAYDKGLTIVSTQTEGSQVIRHAARLGFVRGVYRVVCRLPSGLGNHLHRVWQSSESVAPPVHRLPTLSGSALLNPYVHQFLHRQEGKDPSAGVSGAGRKGSAKTGIPLGVEGAALRLLYQPHPLLQGHLVDIQRGELRRTGFLHATLRNAAAPLPLSWAEAAAKKSRLDQLFMSFSSGPSTPLPFPADQQGHPWIPADERLVVTVDPRLCGAEGKKRGGVQEGSRRRPLTKRVSLHFHLLALSPHMGGAPSAESIDTTPVNRTALYEVHTDGAVTAEEIQAVFAAEGFIVVNDFVHDLSLAQAMHQVCVGVREMSPAQRSAVLFAEHEEHTELPMRLHHWLSSSSSTAETLVYRPLASHSLELMDEWWHTVAQNSAMPVPQRAAQHLPSAHWTPTQMARRLVWHLLRDPLTFQSSQGLYHTSRDASPLSSPAESVAALALGPGVECISWHFPDPQNTENLRALQYALQFALQGGRHGGIPSRTFMTHDTTDSEGSAEEGVLPTEDLLPTSLRRRVQRGLVYETVGCCGAECLSSTLDTRSGSAALLYGEMPGDCLPPVEEQLAQRVSRSGSPSHVFAAGEGEQHRQNVRPSTRLSRSPSVRCSTSLAIWLLAGRTPSVHPSEDTRSLDQTGSVEREALLKLVNSWRMLATGVPVFPVLKPFYRQWAEKHQFRHSDSEDVPRNSELDTAAFAFVRAEELPTAVSCAYCEASRGPEPSLAVVPPHTWEYCPLRLRSVPQAEKNFHSASPSKNNLLFPNAPTKDEGGGPTGASPPSVLLTSVEEMQLALHGAKPSHSTGPLVQIPSRALTRPPMDPKHWSAMNRQKPPMQRRTIRCAYCFGKHHITQCPQLQGGEVVEPGAVQQMRAEERRARHHMPSGSAMRTQAGSGSLLADSFLAKMPK